MATIHTKLLAKLKEALSAVLPIMGIVLILCFTIAPLPSGVLLLFLFGGLLLIIGMMFFNLGAEMAMTPMGERIGSHMARSGRLGIVLLLSFLLGFIITMSEPDLQVLAGQVPSIPNQVLILSVAGGVGLFLAVAVLRMLCSKALTPFLFVFYLIVFVLAFLVSDDFLAIAFDSGGVTTGPMTVPFIMALGVGFASVRSDRNAQDDSFGLISLCSIGPVIAVLILGLLYDTSDSSYSPTLIPDISDSVELWQAFAGSFPEYIREIAVSLLPIVLFFGIFQLAALKLGRRTIGKIVIGLLYTYIGLTLFMTGVNIGFMPAGNYLGQIIAGLPYRWILIPIGMLIGYFIVKAEPAVYVLMDQVEDITSGAISGHAMGMALSLGVAASVGIAMFRVLTGVSILYFLLPGYALALALSFFVPKLFTAIAFDSGGVASGPMTATFLLSFAMGACETLGGNIVQDAFGIVAMVAMTPLIAIQLMGLVYQLRSARTGKSEAVVTPALLLENLPDDEIIEL
ncbi:MAG: DUF1538 domain-containing protein [Lachnospiraceae bacterium]|nr:DUF1538 domain-containing protein [Lachnospiraceae bacterium]